MKTSLAVLFLLFFSLSLAHSSVWFISSKGSNDTDTCGTNEETPCSSLRIILNSITNQTKEGGEESCYLGLSKDEATYFFILDDVTVPPICLTGWTNLHIIGIEGRASIDSDIGPYRGVINIEDSHDVSITNIRFAKSIIGKATLYIKNTSSVAISNVMLPVYAVQSNAILLHNAYDNVSISNVKFFGNDVLVDYFNFQPSVALLVNQGYEEFGGIPITDLKPVKRLILNVSDCSFHTLINTMEPDTNNYVSSSSISQAVLIQLREGGDNNIISFDNITFRGITSAAGSVVCVRHSGTAANNTVYFNDILFFNNTARYGAGVAVYYISQSHDNHVIVRDSVFYRMRATFEGGGVFVASVVSDPTNTVTVKDCNFNKTAGIYGSGIYIFNDPNWFTNSIIVNRVSPPLMSISVDTVQFLDCDTSITEGVINVLNGHINIIGNK